MQEDRDFSYWLDFFERDKPSLAEFIVALETKDTYFLSHEMPLDYNDELYDKVYPSGFMEGDFNKFVAETEANKGYFATRIAIYLWKGLSLDILKSRFGVDRFTDIVGDSLIEGNYEELDIEFHKIMGAMFKSKVVKLDNMIDWGFLHGAKLGEKYGENYAENPQLKNAKVKNIAEIENYRKNGLPEPKNNYSIGDTGNDWLDEDDE